MRIRRHTALAALLGSVAALALALPAGAAAAPELSVQVTHSPSSIPRNSEAMTYFLDVRNEAAPNPEVGDTLTCNGVPAEWGGTKAWFGSPVEKLSFTYQWLRNGAPIAGAGGAIAKGGPLPAYVVTSADAGRTLQCLIEGTVEATNPAESETAAAVTQPPLVVAPLPNPEAPQPPKIDSFATMSGNFPGQVGEELQCSPPAGWSGSPTWTFSWLRNGAEVATGPAYTISAADERALLQCAARGSTGTGEAPNGATALALSTRRIVGSRPAGIEVEPGNAGTSSAIPQVEFPASTSGEVKVELEFPPGGIEARAFKVNQISVGGRIQWANCASTEPQGASPAKVICRTTASFAPQQEAQTIEVQASLGPDTPDPAVVKATVSGGGSAPDSAEDGFSFEPATPFGVASLETKVDDFLGNDYTQAAGHPYSAAARFELNHRFGGEGQVLQVEFLKDVVTDLPAGFVGNPQAVPQLCSGTEAVKEDLFSNPQCPRGSIVGHATLVVGITNDVSKNVESDFPIYAIEPERGAPAQFAFYLKAQKTLITLTPRLRAAEGYAIRIEAPALPKNPVIYSVDATLCGYGTNVQAPIQKYHEGAPQTTDCKPETQTGADAANPKPLLTNQSECAATPPVTRLAIDSWEHPGRLAADGSPDYSDPNWHIKEAAAPKVTGCENVPFEPTIDLQPTSHEADSPTGLDVSIAVPTAGLETPGAISQAALKQAVVILPKGMAVNPAAADGLGACSAAQISLGTDEPVRCPASSKIGSAEVVTPLLERPLTGSVYLAKQGDNPFHSLLALYLVVESEERGILVKIPGHVEPQPDGQLVANFDNNPQVPFSSLKLHFNAGNRAPLLNPPACGTYGISSRLSPWSAPGAPLVATSSFQITTGPNGTPCPNGGLAASMSAGLANPLAGTTSPFVTRISRAEASQRISSLNLSLPPGLTAFLKGVSYCPDAVLAGIPSAEGTGTAQIAAPSCPASSQIGTVTVGVGGGSNPLYVDTGRVYLAGPYKGAPISIAVVAPAVAGPFDLGNVVIRSAAYLDLETARITVKSDPIPTIVHGIPLDVRDIRVNIDRPHFTVAPTNCEVMSVGAEVFGPASGVNLSNRFQVGGCEGLRFKPKLKVQLKGATNRPGHPALKAVLTARPGEAGIARAQVNLPQGEFLDQGNLNKTCTKPVLLAGDCPANTIYGKVKAWTPLLEKPLQGNVYLVGGYGYKLPALVADLNGQVRITLVGKVDSGKNKGIRNTFEVVPDAPVSRFVLEMKGGKKYGLLQNSENLCTATKAHRRAIVRFTGQNGKIEQYKPVVANQCGKGKKKHARRSSHSRPK
jgi:hypothetical protein